MPKIITINQDKLLILKEALNEFMVDKNSNFTSHNSIWFVLYRGDLLFFDYKNRALLDDFLYRHQNELSDFIYKYEENKYRAAYTDFDWFVGALGNSVPYLITGWINNGIDIYINKNQYYDIINSNELYQLVKNFPECRFYIDSKKIDNNDIINNKGRNFPNFWYHGTTCADALSILKYGLRPTPENSTFNIKHDKTVFVTSDLYQAMWYANHKLAYSKFDLNNYPCILKINANKIDKNKIVYDYDVYNGHSIDKNDSVYNDKMRELDITYDNKSEVIQKNTDPRIYKKIGYRGIIMPNSIEGIIVIKHEGIGDELTKDEFLSKMKDYIIMKEESNIELMEAAPEVDEYEIGDEGSNPPVGGNFYHVNESYNVSIRGDLDSINTIEFIPHENAREEGYEDDEIDDFEPYYEIEAMDMNGDTILCADLTVEELFDYFPQSIINDIVERDTSNATRLSNPSINQYRIEDILYRDTTPSDVNNVEEVNRIAKKIQTGGPRAYLLTDGDIIYFHDHIYVNNIDGITPDKFIALGNIRLSNGGFELIKEPTRQQMYELKQWIRQQDGGIYVDFCEESYQTYPRTLFSTRYGSPNAERIVNDIYYYFEEGIKPQDNFYESKDKEKVLENFDFEVDSSEIDLSSFKKKHELVPNIWNPDGKLNSRIRLKLLDIADDFWEYVNLTWVKPSGIILTGSICNFNWSQYSDIDLHLIVDFDEIDEKIEFVKDYLDSKKNEWNNEHSGLQIMGYPVELYVQNLEEMPESNGIYDLEENDWVREPNPDDIKSIGLNKFSIKDKAAKIMTIIDDMYDALASTDDSHKIEQMGNDANYLWKKVKEMRKNSLEKNGESGSGNIVYKILRRTGYLDRLWKLSNVVYDKFNSITESVDEMQAWHGTDAVFDKFDLAFLSKGEGSQEYGKGIYVTSSKSTGEHYVEIIRGVRMNAKGKEYMQKKWNASDDEKENAAQEYQNFLDNYDSIYDKLPGHLYKVDIPDDNGNNYFDYAAPMTPDEAKNIFIEFCKKGLIERGKYSDERYNRLVEKVNAAPYWNSIKSGRDFHLALYKEGMFERFSAILESLGYIGVKVPIGYLHGMKYGRGKNNMNYVIFDPKNVKIVSRKDMLTKKTTKFNESKNIIKEYLEKDNNLPLYKYFKWASTASSCEKARDLAYSCSYYIGKYIRKIYYRYSEFENLLNDGEFDYEDESLVEMFLNMLEENNLCDHFVSEMQSIVDYYELPSWCTMDFNRVVKNEWCIHFGSDSENIAREGFTGGTPEIEHLAYTNAGAQKSSAGYDFAFLINDRSVDYNGYGDEAVIFRTSGVEIYHYGDNQNQVVFWGPNVKSFIPIHQDNGDWVVYGQNGQVLVRCGRPSEIALWATENLPQYRKQIMTGKNGYIPMMGRWNTETNKYERVPYPIYRNESIQRYITLLKESVISEETVADGSSNGNPYKDRWKAERQALKNYVCNYGTVMQSKEDDKGGKLYKVFYDKGISELIGYNYALCVQWDEIQMKPKSIVYIRALDKFTPNIRRNIQYDTRGFDNVQGTYDDMRF